MGCHQIAAKNDLVLINIDVREKPELETIPEVASVIEEVEKALADQGRVLVRYSGTQNMCRVMVEGPTQQVTEKFAGSIAEVVKSKLG